MSRMSLVQIRADLKCKIVEILGGSNLHARLASMGVYKGKEVIKLNHMGLKGPVVIKMGRTVLALGHHAAAKVIVDQS